MPIAKPKPPPGPAARTAARSRARPPARRGRPGYDLESLLDVAVSVFNERGYDGASMGDLSQRLGIAKSSIYYHVDSKEDLLRLALDRALEGLFALVAEVQAGEEGQVPAVARLERLIRGSVAVLTERLPYVTLLLRARGNTGTERQALARRRQLDQIVAGLVRQAQADGDVRPDVDPAVTARLLFGMVSSIGEWYRPGPRPRGRGRGPDAALADAVCAMALDGLRTPRSQTRSRTRSPHPVQNAVPYPAPGPLRPRPASAALAAEAPPAAPSVPGVAAAAAGPG